MLEPSENVQDQDDNLSDVDGEIARSEIIFSNPSVMNNKRTNFHLEPTEIEKTFLRTTCLSISQMNASMALIRERFPDKGGLFNVNWGEFLQFDSVENGNWMQIILQDNHWVLIAKQFPNNSFISIYDSLKKPGQEHLLSNEILYTAAQILKTSNKSFTFGIMQCQQEKDSFNCGVLAFANAVAIAYGQNPSQFIYDPVAIRQTWKLFNIKINRTFPISRKRSKQRNL